MASSRPKPKPKPEPEPEPAAEPEPQTLPVDLLLAYLVDGKPVIGLPLHFDLVAPPAGQSVQVQIPIDARQFVQLLEPHIGPLARTDSGIVVPGSGWVPKH